MKTKFTVELLKFKTIEVLPNAWDSNKYKDLLIAMDYDEVSDISNEELEDMCLMALSDLDPEEAAAIVLTYVFNDRLTIGQIENLAHEMQDEKMWEEYADVTMHEDFFNAHQLLYNAYNGKFPHPEALQFSVKTSTTDRDNFSIFKNNTEASLIRILTKGMPDNTLIKRLYSNQLKGGEFKEAKDILWQVAKETQKNTLVFEIITSTYWFRDFKHVSNFDVELIVDMIPL
ncbi:hypothetical protein GCM10022393_10600 [Aquimarina addita]|uniref:Uncharacterized protein n=1 Tax=Aquimarina addita TaxID=870485 RepID=A0ABP7XD72_9FLAO